MIAHYARRLPCHQSLYPVRANRSTISYRPEEGQHRAEQPPLQVSCCPNVFDRIPPDRHSPADA